MSRGVEFVAAIVAVCFFLPILTALTIKWAFFVFHLFKLNDLDQ